MPRLNMGGSPSQKLNKNTITKLIPKTNVIGNYAFGFIVKNTKNKRLEFVPKYVGRSDNDLQGEIIQQGLVKKVKANKTPRFTHFKFSLATNVLEAYQKECTNYHDFCDLKLLENEIHPARPKGMAFTVAKCTKPKCKD